MWTLVHFFYLLSSHFVEFFECHITHHFCEFFFNFSLRKVRIDNELSRGKGVFFEYPNGSGEVLKCGVDFKVGDFGFVVSGGRNDASFAVFHNFNKAIVNGFGVGFYLMVARDTVTGRPNFECDSVTKNSVHNFTPF